MTELSMLNGYSGFNLSVFKDKSGYCFRKTAVGNVDRLKHQYDKQKKYKGLLDGSPLNLVFEVPDVLFVDNDSIVMRYCFGKNIVDFIQTEDYDGLDWIIKNIGDLLEWEFSKCIISSLDISFFEDKLNNVPDVDNLHNEVLSRVKDYNYPAGLCHGDLTFSNMIFGRKIILVDFHDPFIETPLQDMVKLLQEVDLCWSMLMYVRSYDISKVSIAYSYLRRQVYNLVDYLSKKYCICLGTVFLFHLMVLVRLLAYVKTDVMKDIVLGRCMELIKDEKKLVASYSW